MSAELLSSVEALLVTLTKFDPRSLPPDRCLAVVAELALLEKASAAARCRAAARVAAAGAQKSEGFNSPAGWLASKTGSSTGQAQRNLDTAAQLDALPATREAVNSGELSLEQADEVVKTAKACPGSEPEMLDVARRKSLRDLRDEGRRRRLSAVDPEDLARRHGAARYHRHWKDEHGMIRYSGAMVPIEGIPFMQRLDVETDREFRAARAAGRSEPRERYAADAFARVMKGGSKPHAVRADIVFVANVETGEAHIVGGGPVPMSTVRAQAKDAFVKGVVHDGVKVDSIVHYGRRKVPEHVRTVLELGDAPEFDGVRCVDCGAQFGLEWDHVDPVANDGPTCRTNLRARCWTCHDEKTKRDRLAGLLRGRIERAPP